MIYTLELLYPGAPGCWLFTTRMTPDTCFIDGESQPTQPLSCHNGNLGVTGVPGPNWWEHMPETPSTCRVPLKKTNEAERPAKVFFSYSCHLEKKLLLQPWVVLFWGMCQTKNIFSDLKWNFIRNTKWFDRFLRQNIRSKVPQGKFTATATSNVQPDLTTCHRLQIFLAFGSWLEWHQTYTRRRRLRNWSLLFFFWERSWLICWEKTPTFVCYEAHPDWQTIVIQCDSGKYILFVLL